MSCWPGRRGRPLWQQDALRRLAVQGELTEEDLSELRSQIEAGEGLAADAPEPIPLAPEHLSEAASNAPRTVLASLGPVKNVDRPEPGQPPMRFAVNGVTLIYGPNASGKSGYCRIAKQLCRSLDVGGLRGNVFDGAVPPPPEVGIAYRVGDDDDPKTEATWVATDPPPPELARISVFDTACAGVYVDDERKIEFLPYELDLLNKLGVAVRALEAAFRSREAAVAAAVNTPMAGGFTEGTTASALVGKLVSATALADLPAEQRLRDAATWSGDDERELDEFSARARDDPQVLLRIRREARSALAGLADDVTKVEAALGDEALAALTEKRRDALAKRETAEIAARELFSGGPIPQVGSDSWRQMLIYAREFAAEAFPECPAPQIATAGKCVLCQQDLDASASERLAVFDDYLAGRAAEAAAAAEGLFEEARGRIKTFAVKAGADVRAILASYGGLSPQRTEHAAAIERYYAAAAARRTALSKMIDAGALEGAADLESLPASPLPLIDGEFAALDAECDALSRGERDEEAAAQREHRIAELADKRRLSEQIELAIDRRKKLEELQRLAACRGECRLTAITQQITRRRREILTPSLRSALDDELRALQLSHIPRPCRPRRTRRQHRRGGADR